MWLSQKDKGFVTVQAQAREALYVHVVILENEAHHHTILQSMPNQTQLSPQELMDFPKWHKKNLSAERKHCALDNSVQVPCI